MRTLNLILIASALFGCSTRTTKREIDSFESQLSTELSIELSKVVEHFERELYDRYSITSTEKALEKHLRFVLSFDGLTIEEWLPCQDRKDSIFNIYSKDLINEIWVKPDTVWIKDSRIYTPYWGNSEPMGRKIQDWVTNYDSLMHYECNIEEFNYKGKFMRAVEEISNTNELAAWYYDLKRNAGTVSPHISAQLLLDNKNRNKLSLDDYLVKRIIVIETFTETCYNQASTPASSSL